MDPPADRLGVLRLLPALVAAGPRCRAVHLRPARVNPKMRLRYLNSRNFASGQQTRHIIDFFYTFVIIHILVKEWTLMHFIIKFISAIDVEKSLKSKCLT